MFSLLTSSFQWTELQRPWSDIYLEWRVSPPPPWVMAALMLSSSIMAIWVIEFSPASGVRPEAAALMLPPIPVRNWNMSVNWETIIYPTICISQGAGCRYRIEYRRLKYRNSLQHRKKGLRRRFLFTKRKNRLTLITEIVLGHFYYVISIFLSKFLDEFYRKIDFWAWIWVFFYVFWIPEGFSPKKCFTSQSHVIYIEV